MTKAEIQERITNIEDYLKDNWLVSERAESVELKVVENNETKLHADITYTKMFVLAGEWEGLNKVIGNSETAMSMLWRLRGI